MPRARSTSLVLCLAAVLAALGVSTARADNGGSPVTSLLGGNCGATTTPFAQWGDRSSYGLVAGGDFEPGSAQWTLSGGAKVVAGNEPFHVNRPSDGSSLLVPAGADVTSPATCFGVLNPNIRFFATATHGPATIHVQLISRGLLGALTVLDGGTATVDPGWAPTPVFTTLVSQLNAAVGSKSIQLRISTTGDVQIDDVYNDPFCSR